MSLFNWFGDYGRYGAARLWQPRGVPGAGDTAAVAAGEVVVQGRSVEATVVLGGADVGAPPALDLRSASVATLATPRNVPEPSDTTASVPEYGTVNVRGLSRIGSLEVGAFDNRLNGLGGGHAATFAHDNLTVNLAAGAQLDTGFDVEDGSALTVIGGDRSGFAAGPSTIAGGKAAILAPLVGQGTITMTDGAVYKEGYAIEGTLELGGRVGPGETIDINMGTLQIDRPLDFAGTLNIRAVEDGGHTGGQGVLLRDLGASSYAFDDATHRLTLFGGDTVVDTVQFSEAITSASFKPGIAHPIFGDGLDVFQSPQGVFVRGLFNAAPAGSTELPLHVATG